MQSLKLKEGLYWNGVLDPELRVFDIIMHTEFGTTYNSYIIKGEHRTALVETAKARFFDEYLAAVERLTPIAEIDYLIVNHTEPDHAGSVEMLLERNPSIKVVGTATALSFLKEIVNRDFYHIAVGEGDTLDLGGKTLHFLPLPNLHWPDTMYTYLPEERVLFTCDSFGSHYSHEGVLRSTVTDEEGYWRATKYYFDNIIGPYKDPYMMRALEAIRDLPIDMICTGHGPVLDSHIGEIRERYAAWCAPDEPSARKTVVIPYVSAYGYTRQLAERIAAGIAASGDIDVACYDMVETELSEVLPKIRAADGLLFGTPTIVGEALAPIWALTTAMLPPVDGGKLASAFGSYGWSGEGVPHMLERLRQLRLRVLDGFRVRFKPDGKDLVDAYEFGYRFGCELLGRQNDHKAAPAKKQMMKCLVCGAIFEEGTETCPVCGVGPDSFVPVEAEETTYHRDTDDIFVILGTGAAGVSAAEAIRERNATAGVVMIGDEGVLPYNRPMLTKNMLAGLTPGQLAVHDETWYEQNRVVRVTGRVASLLPEERAVVLEDGSRFTYTNCIYALGSSCFVPPIEGADLPGVIAVRTLQDVERVASLVPQVKEAVVIGGGVLGLEAAWELRKAKCAVTVLEVADRIMGRQLDAAAAAMLQDIAERQGVHIRTGVQVRAITHDPQVMRDPQASRDSAVTGVKLADGSVLPAQLVLISCGIRANTAIAAAAGLEIGRAVRVNAQMETSHPRIYACGDCAEFEGMNFALWSEATEMGKTAGAAAAGENVSYQTPVLPVTFHGMNTALYAIGDAGGDPEKAYKTVETRDQVKHTLEKYFFLNGRLCGGILLGDTTDMAAMTEAVLESRPYREVFGSHG